MKAAIHQPQYYPWIGYFHKIAKADKFILLNEVQLTDSGYMHRNRFLDINGKVKFVTIPFFKKNYMNLPYNKLKINNTVEWQKRNANFLKAAYGKAPYFHEIWNIISYQFIEEYAHLSDIVIKSIFTVCEILQIDTPFLFQSDIKYNRDMHKSNLVLNLCKATGADIYLSGKGASIKYLDREQFKENLIDIEFQDVSIPTYSQVNTQKFIGGISILDMLFNLGIENTRKLFWQNVNGSDFTEKSEG